MDPILKISNIRKEYAAVRALDDVSFEVPRGSIFGMLGPNGAGKTTLLRIINGILAVDSGEVTVDGEPVTLATARHIGYMPEERGLYDNATVESQIMFFARLKDGETARIRQVMDEYLELFNLKGQEKRKVKELSKGNQQKVQIIATLAHEPKLVILDEPFSGFDPINGALLQELIDRLHSRGVTIILSSHNMHAVEEMCSHIALINKGKLLLSGPLAELKEMNKTDNLLLTAKSQLSIPLMKSSHLYESVEPIEPINGRKGFSYRIKKAPEVSNFQILEDVALQSDIILFEEELPSLNDIFIKYTSL